MHAFAVALLENLMLIPWNDLLGLDIFDYKLVHSFACSKSFWNKLGRQQNYVYADLY